MTRCLIDGVQHSQIPYPLVVQKLYEAAARTAELVLYGRCHQLSAAASIA
jgi:hypothetical protein